MVLARLVEELVAHDPGVALPPEDLVQVREPGARRATRGAPPSAGAGCRSRAAAGSRRTPSSCSRPSGGRSRRRSCSRSACWRPPSRSGARGGGAAAASTHACREGLIVSGRSARRGPSAPRRPSAGRRGTCRRARRPARGRGGTWQSRANWYASNVHPLLVGELPAGLLQLQDMGEERRGRSPPSRASHGPARLRVDLLELGDADDPEAARRRSPAPSCGLQVEVRVADARAP